MKLFLQNNDIETYLKHIEGKSVVTKRFNRTLNNKSHKYKASIQKYIYIDKLDDIVNKCNNIYHKKLKLSLLM